jgi:hypothetical protein
VADQTGQDWKAHLYWDTFSVIPCRSLVDNPTSTAAADVARRNAVRARNIAFNDVLEQECEVVLRCRFDDGGIFDRSSNRTSPPNGSYLPRAQWWFEDNDVSHDSGSLSWLCPGPGVVGGGTICGDHFHPSVSGQRKLAQAGHELSYQFLADSTAPTATATPARAPDGGGVYRTPVQVTFGGADASGIRGQEVRIQGPSDSAPGPWQPSIGTAPAVTVSATGTTYVQVRSLDVNGNLSASTTQAITVDPSQFGTVGGAITDADGPLSGIEVSLHATTTEGALATVTTGSDGTYAFPPRLAADDVKVRAHDPSGTHVDQWFDGAATHAAATPVDVPGGGNATADIELPPTPGTLSGTVSGPEGPIEGVVVTVDPGGATDTTDTNGDYAIEGLTPGTYTAAVAAVPCATSAGEAGATVVAGTSADADIVLAADPVDPNAFSDVPSPLDPAVDWITDVCNEPRHMTGFDDGTFRPTTALNRAQAVSALWRINGSPEVATPHGLTGVPAWVEPAVRWAVANQYMTGYDDGSFGPTKSITRAQIVRLLYRLAGEPDVAAPHGLTGVPAWVEPAVRWAVAEGLVSGYPDGSFRPNVAIQRGRFAELAFGTYG